MTYDHKHRHHHRGHGRHHGGGRGFWGHGADVRRGRKLNSDELQLVLLEMLRKGPAHGYELMRQVEAHSGGYYAPSPGMIYPALAYLDDAGEVAVEADGNRKSYRLTPQGEQRLADAADTITAIMDGLARIGSRMEEVREAFAGLNELDPAAAEELHQARREMKKALFDSRGCSPAAARAIAAILIRTAAEIRAVSTPRAGDE